LSACAATRSACAVSTPKRCCSSVTEDDALAQRALGRQQLGDAELRQQRVEDAQAAGHDGAAVVLEAGDLQPVL
jgi:hypothetical protein